MADETVETVYTTDIEVILKYSVNAPTTCRVYRNGILLFNGEDFMGRIKGS
jgi:hypothetical protein